MMITQHLLFINSHDLIPIVAICFTFMIPILAMYFYYQNRNKMMEERKLMIEKGLTPPPLNDFRASRDANNGLAKGINLIAIALGLLSGYLLAQFTNIQFPFSIAGCILFFLGVANVINALVKSPNPQHSTNDEKQ